MEKFKNFVKKHKKPIIKWSIVIVVVIVLLVVAIKLLTPNTGTPVYGNRLDGIEEVKITDGKKSEVESKLTADSEITKVSVDVKGKIINIIVTVADSFSEARADEIANQALSVFSDSEKNYYDFQIYLDKTEAASPFPMIGYKNKTSEKVVWGLNKQVSE